ncbi:MAG: hypothetical protein KJ077_38490 [Anaerolineae bacterium]|nr:hypothetical protein [Anaerolineae bacterium]
MSEFVPVETPGGLIWAEVEEKSEGLETVAPKKIIASFEDVAEALKKNAQFLLRHLEDLSPQEVEVSFGITVGAEAGTPFFGLAKASGESNYTVKLKWKSGQEKSS